MTNMPTNDGCVGFFIGNNYYANNSYSLYNIHAGDIVEITPFVLHYRDSNIGTVSFKMSLPDTSSYDSSWITCEKINDKITDDGYRFGSTGSVASYENSAIRNTLENIIYPSLDNDLKSNIKTIANKHLSNISNSSTSISTTNDRLWIPSMKCIYDTVSNGYEPDRDLYNMELNDSSIPRINIRMAKNGANPNSVRARSTMYINKSSLIKSFGFAGSLAYYRDNGTRYVSHTNLPDFNTKDVILFCI